MYCRSSWQCLRWRRRFTRHAPALAASVEAVLERLATWLTDFAAGSAPATLKTVRSDWMQIHLLADTYLRREFASNSRPAPRSNP